MSHMTSVVHEDTMYLFGGSTNESENCEMYSLDLNKLRWDLIKPKNPAGDPNNPVTRDEHTAVTLDDSMIVFGGFSFGERSNEIFKFSFRNHMWEKIESVSKIKPSQRAGHSAVIRQTKEGDFM